MGYVLMHKACEQCVWGEDGLYNAMCAHCPYCSYSKDSQSHFMLRGMAEMLGLVKPNEES